MDKFAMHRAAKEGDLERVRQLTEGGASVDSLDDRRRTPLHCAAEHGRYDVVDFLISLPECNLNLKDRDGRTPVMSAAFEVKRDVVHLLIQRGAQVNCVDDNMHTLLHFLARRGWTDDVQSILDSGEVDPNAISIMGYTSLGLAAHLGRKEVVELLIRAGADVNQRNANNRTALHQAAFHSHTRVIQVLLEKEGLDLNPQDIEGDTPLHKACYRGDQEVVKQLLAAGANTTLKNNYGETALSEGIRRGKLTLDGVKLLVQHGAFVHDSDYVHISENPVLKENILKDVGLCTQSIVNKFHCQSLPTLNSISYFATKLPNTDKFKLRARQIDEVENLVKCEIERNTFCNVVKAHPMALSALCVLSLISCQSGTKRSASPDFDDNNSPFKNLHT